MTSRNEFSQPEELSELGGRLAEERPELSRLELDRIKARAIAQAGRATRQRKGQFMRSRLATIMAAFALVLGGTGIVWAASSGGGSTTTSSAKKQYCPPTSPGNQHKPPPPGSNNCGH